MASMDRKRTYEAPTKGRNDKTSPLMLSLDEAAELSNFEVNERGILDKAKGYIKDGSPFPDDTDSFIRMLLNYRPSVTSELLLMAALDDGNTNANYKVDIKQTSGNGSYSYIGHTTGTASFTNGNTAVVGVGTSWLSHLKAGDKIKATAHADSAYTEIASVTNDTNLVLVAGGYIGATSAGATYTARVVLHKDFVPRGIVFNNKAIITNGSEKMMTYNNTTLDLITDADAPRAKFLEPHKNRIFAALNSNLYWCAANNEASWDAAATEPIFPQDNGNIVAIKSFADSLIVFKNNGNVYQVVGNFDTDPGEIDFVRKLDSNENIGTIPERTPVVHTDGFLYFLADTGCYRIDSRLFMEKVSYNMDTFVDGANFSFGPTQAKTYTYDTASQWDTGTHNGTIARSSGKLQPYFDLATITDAYTTNGGCAVYLDSSKNAHIAYVSANDRTKVKYKKWLASDNSYSVEEEVSFGYDVYGVSLDVSSGGIAGLAVSTFENTGIAYTKRLYFSQRTGGSWITPELVNASSASNWPLAIVTNGSSSIYGVSLRFRSDGLARIAHVASTNSNNIAYERQISVGSWNTTVTASGGTAHAHCALYLHTDSDPRIAASDSSGNRFLLYSGGGSETSLSAIDNVTVTGTDRGVALDKNSSNQYIYAFCDGGAFKKRNAATTTTSTLDSALTNVFGGYKLNATDQDNYSRWNAGVEKYTFENSSSLTNSAATTANNTPGDRGMHSNGAVFLTAVFGANANEILVRRMAYRGIWTSPEQSDTTLTAWGTYDVDGQAENSATITHEVATNTISPASSYSSIVTGQLIGASASNIYIKNKVTFVLGGFSQPEVGSVVINYTGSGVDCKQALSCSFDNQLYFAIAQGSSTANGHVLVLDTDDAWNIRTYPVSSMCRFKKKLYAGHSAKGDLLVLEQGYSFAGIAYSADCQFKEDVLDSIDLEKSVYKIYVLFEVKPAGSTMTFSYRLDNFVTYGGTSWTSTTIDTSSKGIAEIHVGRTCRSIQMRAENATLDHQVGLIGVVVVYGYLNQR